MMEDPDPSLAKMQFQVAAITSGYKAQDYFRKFPGRFISAYFHDYSPSDFKKEVVMGRGIVDWKDFFAATKVDWLKYIFTEMKFDPRVMQGCAEYIKVCRQETLVKKLLLIAVFVLDCADTNPDSGIRIFILKIAVDA